VNASKFFAWELGRTGFSLYDFLRAFDLSFEPDFNRGLMQNPSKKHTGVKPVLLMPHCIDINSSLC